MRSAPRAGSSPKGSTVREAFAGTMTSSDFGGVDGSIDLAYTSEPLASIAESAGVTHVANPINSDIYTEFIPWHAVVRDALRHHQWPLWDPFSFCGTVLTAAVQSAPYHPLHLIALVLPLPAALTFIATMLFFIAALSMF